MNAILHAKRAEIVNTLGEIAHASDKAPQHAVAHRRVFVQQPQKQSGGKRRCERIFESDDIGRARRAVNRGEIAEPLARTNVAVSHLTPSGGKAVTRTRPEMIR